MTGTILIVSRNDVCTAPTAAALLRRTLDDLGLAAHCDIVPAGAAAAPGQEWCERAQAAVGKGDHVEATRVHHRSKRLTAGHVRSADIILTTGARLRGVTRLLVPSASVRTFTLVEASLLSRGSRRSEKAAPVTMPSPALVAPTSPSRQASGLDLLVELLDAQRGLVPLPAAAPDGWRSRLPGARSTGIDLPDPHGDRPASHRRLASCLREALAGLEEGLRDTVSRGEPS